MNRTDDGADNIIPFPRPAQKRAPQPDVCFNRFELGDILSVYGQMVAAGEWRDYAINHGREAACFSVFRRAAESPQFVIEKRPANLRKQGQFALFGADGRCLKRGSDLKILMRFFNRKLLRIASRAED